MDRRVIGLCVLVGSTVGSLVPEAWGGSAFGMASIVLGIAGGVAGIWLGARLAA